MQYAHSHIIFHWLTALLVLGLVASGLAYSFELADKGALNAHQIMGQALIVVVALRILTRVVKRPAKADTGHAGWERALAGAVHLGLYALLIAFIVTGYVSASALSNNMLLFPGDLAFARSDTGEVLLEVHYALKWVLLALFGLHFAGAMKHALIDRDNTLSSMWFSKN
ncbi:MAG: cytochrome b/b6 domain-containing protein [Pseudomonadota bacterium]